MYILRLRPCRRPPFRQVDKVIADRLTADRLIADKMILSNPQLDIPQILCIADRLTADRLIADKMICLIRSCDLGDLGAPFWYLGGLIFALGSPSW